MRDINASIRPQLVYEHMDATQMTYSDNTFNVVLDKGTLDALMPDNKEGTVSTINKYFKVYYNNINNVCVCVCVRVCIMNE